MTDLVTATTHRSWFSRLGGAFAGMLFGLLLILIAMTLLWWNEGRAIGRERLLDIGARNVASIAVGPVDPANAGRLVHLTGQAGTEEVLVDASFGVARNAIKLRRRVEMFQWHEERHSNTKTQLGGGETTETTYRYERRWTERPIESASFQMTDGHRNPPMPATSQTWIANRVTLGAFQLGAEFIERMNLFRDLPVPVTTAPPTGYRAVDGGYYRGTPENPQVGDLRVRFASVEPMTISLVGQQVGQQNDARIEPARLPQGSIALLAPGTVVAAAMFEQAHAENRSLTWLLRAGGILLLWFGFAAMLRPLRVLADVLPLAGRLVGAGVGLIAGLLALALGIAAIALAWVFYRPLVGGLLLLVTVLALMLGARQIGRAKPVVQPAS